MGGLKAEAAIVAYLWERAIPVIFAGMARSHGKEPPIS